MFEDFTENIEEEVMIESSVNQVALQQKQANISDVSINLHNQEAKRVEKTAEEASNNPVAQNGVQNSNLHSAAVASQPADVVTRLGESNESPNLYQPTHQQTGKIIRPEIQAREEEVRPPSTPVEADTQNNATNPESWATDTNKLVGN